MIEIYDPLKNIVVVEQVCEVCGSPANNSCVDTLVTDIPVFRNAQWHSMCYVEGPIHNRCSEHPFQIKERETEEYKKWAEENLK